MQAAAIVKVRSGRLPIRTTPAGSPPAFDKRRRPPDTRTGPPRGRERRGGMGAIMKIPKTYWILSAAMLALNLVVYLTGLGGPGVV